MPVIVDDEEQSYVIQRGLQAFGTLPGSFSLAVYLLLQHPSTAPMAKEGNCAYQVKRLLSVNAVGSACKAACNAYRVPWHDGEAIPELDPLSMASMLVSIYLHKRVCRMTDPTEWEFITPLLYRDILASGLAIQSIYKSGLGVAILGTSAIYSALGALCAIDKKSFKEYRRRRKQEKFFINSKLEQEIFGCSAIMIAKELVQRFRFGAKIVESFVYGFDLSVKEAMLPPGARLFRNVVKVLTTIHEQKKADASNLGLNAEGTTAVTSVLSIEHPQSWLNGETNS